MIEIPHWAQLFVLLGIALVIIVVPIRILYEMTRDSRERSRRFGGLADRLKERFANVERRRGILGLSPIRFTYEGRPVTLHQPSDDEMVLQLESRVEPRIHLIARSLGSLTPVFVIQWESFRILPRVLTSDPLIDDAIALYAPALFAAYLREAALDGIPAEGKPTGLAESLVVIRNLPGVRRFEVRISPQGGFRLRLRLRGEELLYRVDELESAVHHAFRLQELLVLS